MELEPFVASVASLRERVRALQGQAPRHTAYPDELTAELQTSLEELRVAEEELRQQNEELLAGRHALEAERQRYQELFHLAPDGYLVTDDQGVIREANRAAARLLGATPGSLAGKPLAAFVAVEDRRTFRDALYQVCLLAPPERVHEVEVRLRPRGGGEFYASLRVAAERDADRRATGLRWAVRDVTSQKLAEEQVRVLNEELEERVRRRTAELEAANAAKDEALARERAARAEAEETELRVAFLAQAGAALAASLDQDATTETAARLAVPYLADWCVLEFLGEDGTLQLAAAAHRDPARVEEVRAVRRRHPAAAEASLGAARVARTGRTEWHARLPEAEGPEFLSLAELGTRSVVWVSLPAGDRVLGVMTLGLSESGRAFTADSAAVAEDLARRAAVAIDHARLLRELRQADRHKDQFLAVLAHEVRNPLAALRLALDVLDLRGSADPEARRIRDVLRRQTALLVRLTDDLRDLSRLRQGKLQLVRQRVELRQLVTAAVEATAHALAGRHVEVALPEQPVILFADPARLEQVITNLLTNAAKYTEAGGHVWVSGARSPEGQEVELRVRDDGMGLSPDVLPTVFDLYAQADQALGRSQGGLGIGLALVRTLVELHGGTVQVQSAGPGRGTEFIIRLPAAPAETAAPPATEAGSENGHGRERGAHGGPIRTLRILIVDDNADVAESLATLLELEGHEAELAGDGPTALARFHDSRPDVVLLDLGLPDMNGYEVAARIGKGQGEARPIVVAVTGYGRDEDRRRASEAGFDHFLVKPVAFNELQLLLSQIARGRPGAGGTGGNA